MRGDNAKVTCPSTQVNDPTVCYPVTSGQHLPRASDRPGAEFWDWEGILTGNPPKTLGKAGVGCGQQVQNEMIFFSPFFFFFLLLEISLSLARLEAEAESELELELATAPLADGAGPG
jgi:hypothetical protein